MSRLLTCLTLVWFVAPVAACINDVELPAHEREFRSQYRGPASPPRPPSTDAEPTEHRLLLGGGAALLAGAVALAFTGARRRE